MRSFYSFREERKSLAFQNSKADNFDEYLKYIKVIPIQRRHKTSKHMEKAQHCWSLGEGTSELQDTTLYPLGEIE